MKDKPTPALRASAVSLAIAGLLLATSPNAGMIRDSNADTSPGAFPGDCGTPGDPTACVGAWNLDNVDVHLVGAANGGSFGTFDKATGAYSAMSMGEGFVGFIDDGLGEVLAKLTGKVWPVGEPTGIKAVNDDMGVNNGKPPNCLINTAFLSAADSGDVNASDLRSAHPQPVICSSPFQSHKRFKIAMQPAAVAGIADGAEGKGIDLVFNVADNGSLTPYQVFSKINNYTGKRLKGYKIVLGRGIGAAFQSAGTLGIADKLHLSIGIGEGTAAKGGALDGSNLFEEDGLATFSHGLFGAPDKHFSANGFFDSRTAGFDVAQHCSEGACSTYANPYVGGAPLINSDTIASTTLLLSNYSGPAATPLSAPLFGDWLPGSWQPKGIFFDSDGDPTTDPDLVAWWDGAAWRKNHDADFVTVSTAEFNTWAANPRYAIDDIEDVANLGINYIVKVGDGIGPNFTIRIIPVVADAQVAPNYVGTTPTPLVAIPTSPTTPVASSGGGCAAAIGQAPFDPLLPALAALGLLGLGLRCARRP